MDGALVVAGSGGAQPLAVWRWSGRWTRMVPLPSGSHLEGCPACQEDHESLLELASP